MIGWMRENHRAPLEAHLLVQFLDVVCQILTTTRHRSGKSFILCLYKNTIPAKQAKVHFPYFV